MSHFVIVYLKVRLCIALVNSISKWATLFICYYTPHNYIPYNMKERYNTFEIYLLIAPTVNCLNGPLNLSRSMSTFARHGCGGIVFMFIRCSRCSWLTQHDVRHRLWFDRRCNQLTYFLHARMSWTITSRVSPSKQKTGKQQQWVCCLVERELTWGA